MEDNTIVVFTADHGEFLGDHGIPGKAPFLLDCMLRVPCLIRAPGTGQQGAQSNELVESVDLFPTLCTLAGLETPAWVQGHDLAALVTGKRRGEYRGRAAVYAEAVDKRCLRTREWKLIHYPAKKYGELYHLTEDPYELNNLYDQRPDVREKMTMDYYRHRDTIEDFKNPAYRRFTGTDPKTGKQVTHYLTW